MAWGGSLLFYRASDLELLALLEEKAVMWLTFYEVGCGSECVVWAVAV